MKLEDEGSFSKAVAVMACTGLAFFYVAILYSPTLILRLPPPTSLANFMIRRFICAAVFSVISILVTSLVLPIRSWQASYLFGVYGIRADHIWHAVVFPLFLTSLMYAGSLLSKTLLLVNSWKEYKILNEADSFVCIRDALLKFFDWTISVSSNVVAWRNYVVAPFTEELVFRACMVPLLLCGGFKPYNVVFLSPIFFSLAHLNHLWELYSRQNCSMLKAVMVVGLQLGYTVIFGSYASLLFIRTGHLVAPTIAHIFCNIMGLPLLFSRAKGTITMAFVSGLVGFVWLLFPATAPDLYNDRTDNCHCWQGYCTWN